MSYFWRRECSSCGPSSIQSLPNHSVFYFEVIAPIRQSTGISIDGYHRIFSGISSLLNLCCPTAIARFIVSVVVDPVNTVFGAWPRPHIIQKRHERISPFRTNSNPTTTVKHPVFMISVVASSVKVFPWSILWSLAAHAVRSMQIPRIFSHKASTTLCSTHFQMRTKHGGIFSAVAPAKPVTITGKPNNLKPSESLASKVFEVVGMTSRIGISHERVTSVSGQSQSVLKALSPARCILRAMGDEIHYNSPVALMVSVAAIQEAISK